MRGTKISPGNTVRPLIVAHRGARREAPENSRPAFDIALDHGVDGLEFDVQLSRDGVPVLYHDRTLARMGKKQRRISDHSLEELAGFNRGEPLMILDEVLERYCRRTRLFIEVKSRPHDRLAGRHIILVQEVVERLGKIVPGDRLEEVVILSFDPEVLHHAYGLNPSLKLVWNMTAPSEFNGTNRPPGFGLYGVCLPVRNLTISFSRRVRELGLVVMTYACNTPRQARKARGAGADVIMTDNPRWLVPYMQRKEGEQWNGISTG